MPVSNPLEGRRVGVLVESEFIPGEIRTYQERFSELGAQVELISRLWGQPSQRFISDVETEGGTPEVLEVDIDLSDREVEDYDAIVMAANYTSVRLRYFESPPGTPLSASGVRDAPAVRFFAQAMMNAGIVKGALCHGLWILTPVPELLTSRRVICHEVVLADVLNAGGVYVPPDDHNRSVVVDGDLVTGRSWHEAGLLVDTIAELLVQRK
jgi:protease I